MYRKYADFCHGTDGSPNHAVGLQHQKQPQKQEPPRSKGLLVGGILFLVIAALNFGQGNLAYGIAMLLLGVLLMLKANGVIR